MEDDDVTPDEHGRLDAKYRGWDVLDLPSVLSSMSPASPSLPSPLASDRLVALDVSHNCLTALPEDVGTVLPSLAELNCSCNAIGPSLPASLGKLTRSLRTLRANGNRIASVPDELGNCRGLRTLCLSENRLTGIPKSVGKLANLVSLRLQNNEMRSLPLELVRIRGTLTELDVRGNIDLGVVPPGARGETETILWILDLILRRTEEMKSIDDARREKAALNSSLEIKVEAMRRREEELTVREEELIAEMRSARRYIAAKRFVARCVERIRKGMEVCRKLMAREASKTVDFDYTSSVATP